MGCAWTGSVRDCFQPDGPASTRPMGAPVRAAGRRYTGPGGNRTSLRDVRVQVQLPPGMKDPADLATSVNGRGLLQGAIRQAVSQHSSAVKQIVQSAIRGAQ